MVPNQPLQQKDRAGVRDKLKSLIALSSAKFTVTATLASRRNAALTSSMACQLRASAALASH